MSEVQYQVQIVAADGTAATVVASVEALATLAQLCGSVGWRIEMGEQWWGRPLSQLRQDLATAVERGSPLKFIRENDVVDGVIQIDMDKAREARQLRELFKPKGLDE